MTILTLEAFSAIAGGMAAAVIAYSVAKTLFGFIPGELQRRWITRRAIKKGIKDVAQLVEAARKSHKSGRDETSLLISMALIERELPDASLYAEWVARERFITGRLCASAGVARVEWNDLQSLLELRNRIAHGTTGPAEATEISEAAEKALRLAETVG